MTIPLVDLVARHLPLRGRYLDAIDTVLKHGMFAQGKEVEIFEHTFAKFCGRRYAVGVGSGTDALKLTLQALHIGPGDEVIIPAFTFVSTAFAVIAVGAKPVFVDIDPFSLTLDPKKLFRAATKHSRVIIPVHLYGRPAAMKEIMAFADRHHLFVVEDAAQAHGSSYDGKRAGSYGIAGCFSFYPSKNLGSFGDAGAVVTNDASVAYSVRALGNNGQRTKYVHTEIGTTSRLDTIQAAVLSLALRHLDRDNARRRLHAALYQALLHDLPITLPTENASHCITNYHLYVIRTRKRDALRRYLKTRGIETGIHYPSPMHLTPALKYLGYPEGSFPESEQAAKEVLSLPMYPELKEEQIRTVAHAIRSFFTEKHASAKKRTALRKQNI